MKMYDLLQVVVTPPPTSTVAEICLFSSTGEQLDQANLSTVTGRSFLRVPVEAREPDSAIFPIHWKYIVPPPPRVVAEAAEKPFCCRVIGMITLEEFSASQVLQIDASPLWESTHEKEEST